MGIESSFNEDDNAGAPAPAPAAPSAAEKLHADMAAAMSQVHASPVFRQDAFTTPIQPPLPQGSHSAQPAFQPAFQPSPQQGTPMYQFNNHSGGQAGNSFGQAQPTSFQTSGIGLDSMLAGTRRGGVGEALQLAMSALREAVKKQIYGQSGPVEFRIVPMDGQSRQLLRSAVLIQVDLSASWRGIFVLALEGSGEELVARTRNIGAMQYEVRPLPGDYVNEDFVRAIEATVRENAMDGGVLTTICVVQRGFRWDDEQAVREILTEAVIAAEATSLGNQRINLLAEPNRLTTTVTTGPEEGGRDFLGMPVRVDLMSRLTSHKPNQNQGGQDHQLSNQLIHDRAPRDVGQLGAYMDLRWCGVGQVPTFPGMPPAQLPPFQAAIVITKLESSTRCTLAMQLLQLSGLMPLLISGLWRNGFMPRTVRGRDIQNLGALNIEGNLGGQAGFGQLLKVNPGETGVAHDLITKLIRPNPEVMLRVSDCGTDWYNAAIRMAALGLNPQQAQAIQQEITACLNEMTGGAYLAQAAQVPGGVIPNLVMPNPTPVHLGWYIDPNGSQRDLADIGYLGVANTLGDDPSLLQAWTDTFVYRDGFPEDARMTARWNIIQRATNNSAVCTGRGRLVTLNPVALSLLARAMSTAGVLPAQNTTMQGVFNDQRLAYATTGGVDMSGLAGVYAMSYGNNGGFNGYGGGYYPGAMGHYVR